MKLSDGIIRGFKTKLSKSARFYFVLLLVFTLMCTLGGGIWGDSGDDNGVITPSLWSDSQNLDWYTAYSAQTERATGKPVTTSAGFLVKANKSRLTIENDGIRELDLAINGQRLNLNTFFNQGNGTVSFDISNLIRYGKNTIEYQALGKPHETATIRIEAPVFSARILHLNDIHAKIDSLPKAAAYIKAVKSSGNNVYFIDAGDDFSGNPVSDLNKGEPVIEILNAMGADVLGVGNHNFDHGPSATQSRRDQSNFPWVSANITLVDQAATPLRPFEPYKIFTNGLGQKIAFIGLTETPPSTGAKNIVGLQFTAPFVAAEQAVKQLRDQVNIIVLVSHNGHDIDKQIAEKLTGVDLILGAHSHTYLSAPEIVNNIPIIQTGSDAKNLADLIIKQDTAVRVSGGATGGAYTVTIAKITNEDPGVKAIVDKWNTMMGPILDAKVGYTPIALNRDDRYNMDVSIGNLITDAMCDYMNTQIALTNNGGIRASIPAGNITMRHIYSVLPFGNFIMKFNLTGAQIRQIIEHSWNRDQRYQLDLQTSGLTYTIYTKPDSSIDRLDLKVNGQPLDPAMVYSVAVVDYLGTGGGGYPIPSMAAPVDMSSDVDAIVVGEYIKKIGNLNYTATAGRIKVKAAPIPVPVSKLNFYNSSSLLGDNGGVLGSLNGTAATILVSAESTAYQYERNSTSPKNFQKINAGVPIPLAAWQQIGGGKLVGLGAIIIANGYRTSYQNPQWFTNLLDSLAGNSGTILFDEGHGQYYNASRLSSITGFLSDRGYTISFTGTNKVTPGMLAGVKVFVITTPGNVGVYTAEELAVLRSFVAGGGSVILASQTDYNNNSCPVELNNVAAAIGSVIRFNSDEIRDKAPNIDGTSNYSPLTNEFNPNYPELLKAR